MDEFDVMLLNLISSLLFLLLSIITFYVSLVIANLALLDAIMIAFIPLFPAICFFLIFKIPRLFGSEDVTYSLALLSSILSFAIDLTAQLFDPIIKTVHWNKANNSWIGFLMHYLIITILLTCIAVFNRTDPEQ